MNKLTLKAYAKKHKLSIFNAMKMVKEGSVTTHTELVDGKEILYILEDDVQEKQIKEKVIKYTQTPQSLEKEVEQMKKEIQNLRNEIEALKKAIV